MEELLTRSALDLARLVRDGEVSPVEVVEAHVRRCEAVNPVIHGIVNARFEPALAEAKECERRLGARRTGDLPPLFGVPYTIKESHGAEGLPQTGGLVRRKGKVAPEDSEMAARMKAAGAILLGNTNLPEAMMWYESYSRVYPGCGNPHDPRRTPGGSSGGEAAIVGAAGSPLGVGGDVGGSIRIPSFLCGVAGHKSSPGRIPETGVWPGAKGKIYRYKCHGPMGRRVRDLVAAMRILSGPDGRDPSIDAPPLEERFEIDPREVRVYYYEDLGLPYGVARPAKAVAAAVRKSASALAALGMRVEPWRPPHAEKAFQIWAASLSEAGGKSFLEVLGDGEPVDLGEQWRRLPSGRSDHIFPSLALATLERLTAGAGGAKKEAAALAPAVRRAIEEKLGPRGVLLAPPFHRTAPRRGAEAALAFLGFLYSGFYNPMELPGTVVPTGLAEDGLPVGVQVLGAPNRDLLTLWVAERIEEAFGGWRPARVPGVDR